MLIDRDKISNFYRGPSIDASCQVSVHLAKGFQRRRLKCEKLTDDRRRTPRDGKSSHYLWQGELKRTNNVLQNTTQKTKDRTTRTSLKPGSELRCTGSNSGSTCGIHRWLSGFLVGRNPLSMKS